MRIATIAAAFAALFATAAVPANASEIYRTADLKSPPSQVVQDRFGLWDGLSVGVSAGTGWGDWNKDLGLANPKGNAYGGNIAYRWERGPIAFGVDGSLDKTDIVDARTDTWCTVAQCGFAGTSTSQAQLNWLSTFGAHIGMPIGRAMPYIGAGYVLGEATNSGSSSSPYGSSTWSTTGFVGGWYLKGGLEYAVYQNLSVFGEFTHYGIRPDGWSADIAVNTAKGGARLRF